MRPTLPLSLVLLTAGALVAACGTSPSATPPTSSGAGALPSAGASTAGSAAPSVAASASASAGPSASASASAAATPVKIPATVTGLHVAGVQSGAWPDSNVPFGALRLWDNGTAWSQIETTQGHYNWALLDGAVATAQKHRMSHILLVLGSTPTWNATHITTGDYPVPGAASPPKSLAAWDAFVRAVATRYKGRIDAYQIWNEASLKMFWSGTPQAMADLTARAHDIIKAIDPKATVVAASTTVRLSGAFNHFFPQYLAALAAKHWPVDVFSAHLYPASRGTTDDRLQFITEVKGALAAAHAPALPVWDTELNYGLAGPGSGNPHQSISGDTARDWVVQTEFDSLQMGLTRTYWYIWTPKPYPLLGLQLTNDSGAAAGLRIVNQWIVGGTTTGCTVTGGVTACPVLKNDVQSLIAWSDTASTMPVPAGYTQVCTTANDCTPASGSVDVGPTPVRLLP